MTATRFVKAVSALRRLPPLAAFHRMARLIPFAPLDAAKLRFLRFDGRPTVPASMLRGRASVRETTPADLPGLTALQGKRAIFEARFAVGDHCVVAIDNGRIVGYEWFCVQPVHRESEWDYPIHIPSGCVYAYDAYIDPRYRNGGVWLRFKAHLGEWMAARGARSVITFVEDGNVASWRAHVRFGFVPAETVLVVKVCGLRMFRAHRPQTAASPLCASSMSK